jgi:hypothetical protein
MTEDVTTLEEQAAAFRKRGFEVEIVDGEIQASFGRKRTERTVKTTGDRISTVLAPSGLPVVKGGKIILPQDSLFRETELVTSGRK